MGAHAADDKELVVQALTKLLTYGMSEADAISEPAVWTLGSRNRLASGTLVVNCRSVEFTGLLLDGMEDSGRSQLELPFVFSPGVRFEREFGSASWHESSLS